MKIVVDGVTWSISLNGDCISPINLFYNVYTKESNFTIDELKEKIEIEYHKKIKREG